MSAAPRRQVPIALNATQTGTLLGIAAWVLGALQIMSDRGHAEGDEHFHDLYQQLHPRLEALVDRIAAARAAGDEAFRREAEAAYQSVREAFEDWIRLTASDTFGVALGQRLTERLDAASASETPPAEQPPGGN